MTSPSLLVPTSRFPVLVLYGATHIVVDACSAAVVFGILARHAVATDTFLGLLLLYHAMAFGLQPLLGLAVDRTGAVRLATALGCLVSAVALLLSLPMAAVIITGIGNALFHVGGGVVALRITPQRVTAPGFFVAPGSLGLLLGAILGRSGPWASYGLLLAALALLPFILSTPVPREELEPKPLAPPARLNWCWGWSSCRSSFDPCWASWSSSLGRLNPFP